MAKDISIEQPRRPHLPGCSGSRAPRRRASRGPSILEPPCVFNRSVMCGRGASSALAHAACGRRADGLHRLPPRSAPSARRCVGRCRPWGRARRREGGHRRRLSRRSAHAHGVDSALWSTVFVAPRWRPGVALRGRGGDRAAGGLESRCGSRSPWCANMRPANSNNSDEHRRAACAAARTTTAPVAFQRACRPSAW